MNQRQRFFLVALVGAGVGLSVACSSPTPTPTPDIQATVATQVAAHLAAIPTLTPVASPTPAPTSTQYPTSTLYQALPTYTPEPTYTPLPTSTPFPTQRFPLSRTITVEELSNHETEFWRDGNPLLLVGCRTLADRIKGGPSDYFFTFSWNGKFDKHHYLAGVAGFDSLRHPEENVCYEMQVEYLREESYCYWVEKSSYLFPRPYVPSSILPLPPCTGWVQLTPEFKLLTTNDAHFISRQQWRSKYWDEVVK